MTYEAAEQDLLKLTNVSQLSSMNSRGSVQLNHLKTFSQSEPSAIQTTLTIFFSPNPRMISVNFLTTTTS
jgi:hypothetical protein